MAISLQNILRFAENSGQNPDGSPFQQRSGPNALTYPENETPLIIKDILGIDDEPNGALGLVNQVTDNFVRGGVIGLGNAVIDDVKRLGKVLISPNGLAWSASQLALSLTNPQTLISPRNRLTLPINTLLTAGTGAAGVRFRKDGLLDIKFESGYNYDPTKGGPKYEAKIVDQEEGRSLFGTVSDHTLKGLYNRFVIGSPLREDLIKSYSGGVHSTFGIGNTEIKRYKSNPYNDIGENGGYLPQMNPFLPLLSGTGFRRTPTSKHRDYRSVQDTISKVEPIPNEKTRINLYNLGDPGLEPQGPEDEYAVYDIRTIDRISAAGIFKRQDLNMGVAKSIYKDYIKFRIAVVDTDTPTVDNVIQFRALLDNIADNFTGEWNSFKYNGRAEKFYTYGGFDRSIDFGFKIHTQTRHEQKPLWRKLNYLVAQTAPEYKNRRMRGVFSRLTIGDWMNEIPGFFTSVNLSWSTAYPWEIRHDEKKDADLNEYPHILDVSCNFQPVHNFAPSNSPTTPFILPEIGVENSQKYAQLIDGESVEQNRNGVADNAAFADIDYRLEPLPEAPTPSSIDNPTLDEALDNRELASSNQMQSVYEESLNNLVNSRADFTPDNPATFGQ